MGNVGEHGNDGLDEVVHLGHEGLDSGGQQGFRDVIKGEGGPIGEGQQEPKEVDEFNFVPNAPKCHVFDHGIVVNELGGKGHHALGHPVLQPGGVIGRAWRADGTDGFVNGIDAPHERHARWREQEEFHGGRGEMHHQNRRGRRSKIVIVKFHHPTPRPLILARRQYNQTRHDGNTHQRQNQLRTQRQIIIPTPPRRSFLRQYRRRRRTRSIFCL
mmetsp:Transcript_8783/g.15925  ORF Transcript_8783/g.15925 Transcript_8783/m.15925 type:complete len:215 (+) Transcript_8783:2514-3158(+)